MLIYLISEPPNFCPECGHSLEWYTDNCQEFYDGDPFTCKCGCEFAHRDEMKLRELMA